MIKEERGLIKVAFGTTMLEKSPSIHIWLNHGKSFDSGVWVCERGGRKVYHSFDILTLCI